MSGLRGWAQAEIWCGAGGDMVGGAQQNSVTSSPFNFGLGLGLGL